MLLIYLVINNKRGDGACILTNFSNFDNAKGVG